MGYRNQKNQGKCEKGNISADVIVIGAGASGLMSAIAAARQGASVIVIEHTSVSAKKILSTGNGRCNFTNSVQTADCYRSDDPEFVMQALHQFPERDTISFFEDLGVCAASRNGYYYPRSGQALAIRDALILETKRLSVRFFFKTEVTEIRKTEKKEFQILTSSGNLYAGRCILATGGTAAPKTGSDGSGYALARSLGHKIKKPLSALVPLISSEPWLNAAAGVRAQACVSLLVDGSAVSSDNGELQFTQNGISGIPVFNVSRFASVALDEGRRVAAQIDFVPEISRERLARILSDQASLLRYADGKNTAVKTWQQILDGLVNQKIARVITEDFNPPGMPVSRLPEKTLRIQMDTIVCRLKETTLRITGTGSSAQSQTTCGGVPLKEVGADMQSKLVSGLYFAGEILNVDGICGGYNLQWAWTSGFVAGSNAGKMLIS